VNGVSATNFGRDSACSRCCPAVDRRRACGLCLCQCMMELHRSTGISRDGDCADLIELLLMRRWLTHLDFRARCYSDLQKRDSCSVRPTHGVGPREVNCNCDYCCRAELWSRHRLEKRFDVGIHRVEENNCLPDEQTPSGYQNCCIVQAGLRFGKSRS
jgi:hypothetical protein